MEVNDNECRTTESHSYYKKKKLTFLAAFTIESMWFQMQPNTSLYKKSL